MENDYGYIDMHIHTDNSDGQLSPKEVIEEASKNNTSFISIADHDSISGLNQFKQNLLSNMTGTNGIEFSAYIEIDGKKYKIHILGYGFDQNETKFHQLVEEMKNKRIFAHRKLIHGIEENTKLDLEESMSKVNIERYSWFDREIIKQLKSENLDDELMDKVKKYLEKEHFQYDKDYYVNAKKVIDTIHSAGGYVVFAHPMDYDFYKETITKIILKLTTLGIDGLEIYQSECTKEDSAWLKKMTEELGLLYSAGSDFHRFNADGRVIGHGINESLCIKSTSLSKKLIKENKTYKGE